MRVQDGQGWRLAVDPLRQPFSVLVGGADWAVELSLDEALGLRASLEQLLEQHRSLRDQLMAEEAVEIELDRPLGDGHDDEAGVLWLGLQGDRNHWGLRFVLTPARGQRAVEGQWPPEPAFAFATALLQHPQLELPPERRTDDA